MSTYLPTALIKEALDRLFAESPDFGCDLSGLLSRPSVQSPQDIIHAACRELRIDRERVHYLGNVDGLQVQVRGQLAPATRAALEEYVVARVPAHMLVQIWG